MESVVKNPVERKITEIELTWLAASEDELARIFIWRAPSESSRLIHGFFALQQQAQSQNDYTVPDLFISFMSGFETSYGYSHELEKEFIERYEVTKIDNKKWEYLPLTPCYTSVALMSLFENFAKHYHNYMRYLAIILTPNQVSDPKAFNRWLRELLDSEIPSPIRIILIDSYEKKYWQELYNDYPEVVKVVELDIDEDKIMRQTLNESPTTDGNQMLRFRQLMLDTFGLLKTGTAKQIEERGQKAIKFAMDNNWYDQQVVMYSMVAGGWLKEQNTPKAIDNYRYAKKAAEKAQIETRYNLITQSLMGEAGAWVSAQEYVEASHVYHEAALAAQEIPNPTWVIEGYRVAGFCLLEANKNLADAATYYYEAISHGIALPSSKERIQTTFMIAIQDLLQVLDNKRVTKLNSLADTYKKQQITLIETSELKAKQFGRKPTTEQIADCDKELQKNMEALFYKTNQQRENLINGAKSLFQQLVSVARFYSHSFWSCCAEISHPYDLPMDEWQRLDTVIKSLDEDIATEQLMVLVNKIIAP